MSETSLEYPKLWCSMLLKPWHHYPVLLQFHDWIEVIVTTHAIIVTWMFSSVFPAVTRLTADHQVVRSLPIRSHRRSLITRDAKEARNTTFIFFYFRYSFSIHKVEFWNDNSNWNALTRTHVLLTHSDQGKMAAIFQTTFSNALSWMKMYVIRLRFHLILFLRVQLIIFQRSFS